MVLELIGDHNSHNFICCACGHTFAKARALSAHLGHCYFFHVYRDNLEEAPFYEEMMRRNEIRKGVRKKWKKKWDAYHDQ